MAYTSETRVRLTEANEAAARAHRTCNAGNWLVERYWKLDFAKGGYFNIISSHVSEEEANKAKAKLDRKIAKNLEFGKLGDK